MSADFNDVLIHHGVKGMKWGVRKKIETAKSNRKAKRIQKFENKTASSNIRLSDLKKELNSLPPGFKSIFKRQGLKSQIKEATKFRDLAKLDLKRVKEGKLTSTQRQLLVGSIAAAAAIGVGAYLYNRELGNTHAAQARVKQILTRSDSLFPKDQSLSGRMSADDILNKVSKNINPDYRSPGGSMNCRRTTFAYEMRRRGYDVQATLSLVGAGQNESGFLNTLGTETKRSGFSSMSANLISKGSLRAKTGADSRSTPATFAKTVKFVDTDKFEKSFMNFTKQPSMYGAAMSNSRIYTSVNKSFKASYASRLSDSMKDLPSGARGEAVFNFKSFGHSLSFEKIDGELFFFDNQKAKKYAISELDAFIDKWGTPSEAILTRLDDIPLNLNHVAKWVKAR